MFYPLLSQLMTDFQANLMSFFVFDSWSFKELEDGNAPGTIGLSAVHIFLLNMKDTKNC